MGPKAGEFLERFCIQWKGHPCGDDAVQRLSAKKRQADEFEPSRRGVAGIFPPPMPVGFEPFVAQSLNYYPHACECRKIYSWSFCPRCSQ
jgi:hypothetical protein